MEWITEITPHLSGLPWPAVLIVVLLTVALTKGPGAFTTVWRFFFGLEKYRDQRQQKEHDALVAALEKRIDALEGEIKEIKREAKEERLASAKLLTDEKAAHAKCQTDMAELRGDVRVMQEKIDRLNKHNENNAANVKGLKEAVKQIDPAAATKIP